MPRLPARSGGDRRLGLGFFAPFPLSHDRRSDAEYIQAHKVGIATIEDLTGLAFFSALPDRKQRQLRASCTDVSSIECGAAAISPRTDGAHA